MDIYDHFLQNLDNYKPIVFRSTVFYTILLLFVIALNIYYSYEIKRFFMCSSKDNQWQVMTVF